MIEKDVYFLREAFRVAHDLSQDANTQVGALIVLGGTRLFEGANRIPYGMPGRFERGMREEDKILLGRPEKYAKLTHAEPDACSCAEAIGEQQSIIGTTMYCTWNPCTPCAKIIKESGIKRVVTHQYCDKWYAEKLADDKRINWDKSTREALEFFAKSGIKYECLDVPILGIEILFDNVVRKT